MKLVERLIDYLFWKNHQEELEHTPFDRVQFSELMDMFRGNEDFIQMLKMLARSDKENVFRAVGDEKTQRTIQGQYTRTLFLIRQARKEKKESKPIGTKIAGRYA